MALKTLTRWRGGVAVVVIGALLLPVLTAQDARPTRAESKTAVALRIAVQKAREIASRSQSQKNLRQIGGAMLNYADELKGLLPPRANLDKNGKPMLSWRVLILPYLKQKDLYNQFHLNEPWDSENNKKLLAKMPKVYAAPQDEKALAEHATHYQILVGKGTIFESKRAIRLQDITDGLAFTILVVESSTAVPWTKPEDTAYDPDKPPPKFGLRGDRNFSVLMADASVRFFTPALTESTLRCMITRNDGFPLGSDF